MPGQSRDDGTEGDPKMLTHAFVTNNAAGFWTIARRGVDQADQQLAEVEAEFRLTADAAAKRGMVVTRRGES
jgi:hypothetical protein